MHDDKELPFLSTLRDELGSIEVETFEIQDHVEMGTDLAALPAGTTSCTSTTSSCSSSSGTSCCG